LENSRVTEGSSMDSDAGSKGKIFPYKFGGRKKSKACDVSPQREKTKRKEGQEVLNPDEKLENHFP